VVIGTASASPNRTSSDLNSVTQITWTRSKHAANCILKHGGADDNYCVREGRDPSVYAILRAAGRVTRPTWPCTIVVRSRSIAVGFADPAIRAFGAVLLGGEWRFPQASYDAIVRSAVVHLASNAALEGSD
jgi:hypothetical protein